MLNSVELTNTSSVQTYPCVHTHVHPNCEHQFIKYCSVCDSCYCSNCGKEWKHNYSYNYPKDWIVTYGGCVNHI